MLRVAVLGYGYWGPKVVRNFLSNGCFQVAAVAERRAAVRAEIARHHPRTIVLEDAAEAVTLTHIDAVAIATPVVTHFALAREALSRGKHVLVEKPLCTTIAEAHELITLAEKVGRVLMVDHTFLFTGAVQKIDQVVKAGELGKICYFDSMRVNLGLFQPDVNCLWDLAPHDLSVIDRLIDDEIVGIEATGYCHLNRNIPDIVYLTLHFAHDVVAHLNMSWMSPVKVRRFAIGGKEKMLIWDDLDQEQKIRIYNSGIEYHRQDEKAVIIPDYRVGDIYSPRISRHEALAGVVEHFANVIAGREASIMDGHRGLRVVRVLEEAQQRLDRNLRAIAARRRTLA